MKLIVCIGKDTKHKSRKYDATNIKKSEGGCRFFEAQFNWLYKQQEGTEMPTGKIYKLDSCKAEYYFALLNGLTHVFVYLKGKYEGHGKQLAKLIKEVKNTKSKFWSQVDISKIVMHKNKTESGMNLGQLEIGITDEDWKLWKDEANEFDSNDEMLLLFNANEIPVSVIQFAAGKELAEKKEINSIIKELKLKQFIALIIGTMDGQDDDKFIEEAWNPFDQSMRNARQAILLTTQKPFEEAASIVNKTELESFKKRFKQ